MDKETKIGLGLKYDKPTDFYNIETFNSNFKKLEDAVKNIDIVATDEDIDVVAEKKKLNVVLSELRSKDIALEAKNVEQDIKIDEYKASVDDLNNTLTGYVARHKTANDGIRTIVGDKIE